VFFKKIWRCNRYRGIADELYTRLLITAGYMIAAVDNTTVIADVSDRDVLVHKHATGREPLEINHEPLEATKTPQ
jgi:hypothetical protein